MNSDSEQNPVLIVTLSVDELKALIRQEFQNASYSYPVPTEGAHKPYLTVKEAAKMASLAQSTVRLYIRKGELKASKVGRRVVVPRIELEKFLSLNPTGVMVN